MPIEVGALLEISNVGIAFGQEVRNVWQYEVTTTAPTITAAHVAEGWWNHVKAAMRAVPVSTYATLFQLVEVRELNNPSGALGSYGVPTAEQAGTRTPGSAADLMPSFAAVGVRLNVGSRVTRAGQKRLVCLNEGDNTNGLVAPGVVTVCNTLFTLMIASMTLGAPAATMTLQPIVTKKDALGQVIGSQPIESWTVNPYITTQNTRKVGRGS